MNAVTPLPADWHQWPAWFTNTVGGERNAQAIVAAILTLIGVTLVVRMLGWAARHGQPTRTEAYTSGPLPVYHYTETKFHRPTPKPEPPMPLDTTAFESGDIEVLQDRITWLARRAERAAYGHPDEDPKGDAIDRLSLALGILIEREANKPKDGKTDDNAVEITL